MFRGIFMTSNLAAWDRWLRTAPAIIWLWAYAQGHVGGVLALAFGVVSSMLLVSSLTGACSIYGLFGLSTRRRRERAG